MPFPAAFRTAWFRIDCLNSNNAPAIAVRPLRSHCRHNLLDHAFCANLFAGVQRLCFDCANRPTVALRNNPVNKRLNSNFPIKDDSPSHSVKSWTSNCTQEHDFDDMRLMLASPMGLSFAQNNAKAFVNWGHLESLFVNMHLIEAITTCELVVGVKPLCCVKKNQHGRQRSHQRCDRAPSKLRR